MTPLNKALIGALAVQVLLTAVTWWPTAGGPSEATDLIGFPVDAIQRVSITGRMAHDEVPVDPVVLARSGSDWVVESSDGFPATAANMTPLLDALERFKVREPIATTEINHVGLEVADAAFTRKVEITSTAGDSRTLYLGAGQGKTTHVRVAGETNVFDVRGFAAWNIAEMANRYFDRDFLKVDAATIATLTLTRPGIPPYRFDRLPDGNWNITPTPPGKVVDSKATHAFVGALLVVRMLEPAGKELRPEFGLDQGAHVEWTVATETETTSGGYRLGAAIPGKAGRVWLKSEHSPFVVELLEGTMKHAHEKPVEALFVDAP